MASEAEQRVAEFLAKFEPAMAKRIKAETGAVAIVVRAK